MWFILEQKNIIRYIYIQRRQMSKAKGKERKGKARARARAEQAISMYMEKAGGTETAKGHKEMVYVA